MRSRTWAWALRRVKPCGYVAQGVMQPELTKTLWNAELFPSKQAALAFKRNYSLTHFEPVGVRLA